MRAERVSVFGELLEQALAAPEFAAVSGERRERLHEDALRERELIASRAAAEYAEYIRARGPVRGPVRGPAGGSASSRARDASCASSPRRPGIARPRVRQMFRPGAVPGVREAMWRGPARCGVRR